MSPKPKLVINLVPSYGYSGACGYYMAHAEKGKEDYFGPHRRMYAEIDTATMKSTDRRIATFLEQAVLVRKEAVLHLCKPSHTNDTSQPVAIQTNAVVIVHDDCCSLAQAFGSLCEVSINPEAIWHQC